MAIQNTLAAKPRLCGVFAPVLTPFTANLEPDVKKFIAHCKWLVSNNAGLAIFGTNSEANSLSVGERITLTEKLVAAGVPASTMMPGTGNCALTDTVTLSRHAVEIGAPGVLMLPPFYYKGVSDDGLFAYYSEVIERVADSRLAIYLYHIPQFTQVPITLKLIERLLKRYPGTIAGAKDSSGDWDNSKAMIDNFSAEGFAVFPASESFLSRALPIGAAGCISATVNVNPGAIAQLYRNYDSAEVQRLQESADRIRKTFQGFPMIPAMKYTMAQLTGDSGWKTVRPPLTGLSPDVAQSLLKQLRDIGYFNQVPEFPAA
jgi:4-hydroxy-tetrahydrodipicolinate synthase